MINKTLMQILWDEVTRQVIIVFSGEVFELPGPFLNREQAMAAAEAHCQHLTAITEQDAA